MTIKASIKREIDERYWETIRSIRKEYPIGGISPDGLVSIVVYRENTAWGIKLGKVGGIYKVAVIEEIWD
jgi:hypothetical protein